METLMRQQQVPCRTAPLRIAVAPFVAAPYSRSVCGQLEERMPRYKVFLHAHAGAEVEVDAPDAQEANRLAQEAVRERRAVRRAIEKWTPTMTVNLDRKP